VELEKQVEDLLLQLQASRGGGGDAVMSDGNGYDLATMLTTDNFGFGEMLSSAAQWPEWLDTGLGDLGFDQGMLGTGYV
jgi:hypothetical protein